MGSEHITKKIVVVTRNERALTLKENLKKIGITAMTIADITTWTLSKKIMLQRRGIPVTYDLTHRAKIEIIVTNDLLDRAVDTIIQSTKTGKAGDGILYVTNVEDLINISTSQKGENAFGG